MLRRVLAAEGGKTWSSSWHKSKGSVPRPATGLSVDAGSELEAIDAESCVVDVAAVISTSRIRVEAGGVVLLTPAVVAFSGVV